jgi:hypothetical protein
MPDRAVHRSTLIDDLLACRTTGSHDIGASVEIDGAPRDRSGSCGLYEDW